LQTRQERAQAIWKLDQVWWEGGHAAAEDLVAPLTWLGPDVSVVHRLLAAGPTVDDGSGYMDAMRRVGDVVTAFVAELTGRALDELPVPAESGDDWLAVLRLWLARLDCGLVSIANPEQFSWPGHWIGIVDAPGGSDHPVAVLLFGTPSAVIASPAAPDLVGNAVDELRFRQALVLVPYQPFQKPVADAARTVGAVIGIYISAVKTGPMQSLVTATALPGRGLLGDRYAAKAGTFTPRSDRLRGYDLTLIESEVLDRVTCSNGSHLSAAASRRNVVTKGIDLNALVGREFTIGVVRALGQRLCEPCVHLQRLTTPGVVAGFVHRGGLRADILTEGEIRLGDTITAAGQSNS
jgi:MOSC domain-containing protein